VRVPDPVELIGYLASGLIVLSLLMASVLKLRVINLVGATVFTAYGILIGSIPVALTNGAIVLIDVYYLVRMLRDRAREAYFEVVDVDAESRLLRRFVEFHRRDIEVSQPRFAGVQDDHLAWMVLRDAVPVGVVLARREGDRAHLDLDYVVPAHRDFTAGTVLFGHSGAFRELGIAEVTTTGDTDLHRRYLDRMGFADRGDQWVREVR
jgi:hypothetical protein